jgi:DNA-nicking Smr family endonuclease
MGCEHAMTSDEDPEDKLFREAMRDVRKLSSGVVKPARPKPTPEARFTRADQKSVLAESLLEPDDPALLETCDELRFRRPGVPEVVLKRLRRGEFAVDAEIDLHGMTAIEARAALKTFIEQAVSRHMTCIRIVHGKGRRSGPRGPVLKNIVNLWLQRTNAVLAFGSPPPIHGGSGAVYVLLRR